MSFSSAADSKGLKHTTRGYPAKASRGSCDDVEGSPPPKGHNSKGSNTTLLKLKQLSFTALTAAAACALVLILAQGLTAQWNAQRHPKTPIIISGLPVSCQYSAGTASNKVAIVITVHGALAYLAGCLSTLAQHTTGVHLFIADDSANATESATVKAMLQTIPLPSTHIVMGDDPKGYTLTVNAGLRQAHKQGFQVMVCLNSDTELTINWLESLLSVLESDKSIGMAGPIGNAASYQSVPQLTDPSGAWSSNPLLPGWTPNMMARLAFLTSNRSAVQVPILNGFLMAIKREVFDAIGFMDEELFPFGFGEENDFALRAGNAGFKRVVVPWVYVYHHKTKSYTTNERKDLVAKTTARLEGKYKEVLKGAVAELKNSPALNDVRSRIQLNLQNSLLSMQADFSVLFVLNIMPYNPNKQFMLHGGWISLVQEALGLSRNGAHVRIAVQMWTLSYFAAAFPAANARGIFWGYNSVAPQQVAEEILSAGTVYDFVVATHYTTADIVLQVLKVYPNIIPGYYVQDVETKFHADSAAMVASRNSYINLQHGFIFVKTQWLQQKMAELFGIAAHLIPPTIDNTLFRVDPTRRGLTFPLHFCAMVRVETPRRNPLQTLQIMSTIVKQYGADKAQATVFGSSVRMVTDYVKSQNESLGILQEINLLGVLGRKEVASLSRKCDIFIDFSAWQAFGRSGLEAMASGCVPILPESGGANEYAQNGVNAFLIDTSDVQNALSIVDGIMNKNFDLAAMRTAAIATAQKYSIEKSSAATAQIFRSFKQTWEAKRRLRV